MMKMATEEGFLPRQGARTGLDWFSVATEASGGGTPDLLCSSMFLGYMEIYRRKKYIRGPRGAHEGGGCAQGGGCAPLPRGSLVRPPVSSFLLYKPTYPETISNREKTLVQPP